MKKLLAITLSGLIGLSVAAQAQTQPETQVRVAPAAPTTMTSDLSKIYGSGTTGRSTGRPVITTDAKIIYGVGHANNSGVAKFVLTKGHYIIGTDEGETNEPYSLFVNPSANDPDSYVALYIENNVFSAEVGTAQIMMGSPTNNGVEIQFSPTKIGISGHLEDSAYASDKARVLRISKRLDAGQRGITYPYMVRRLNIADGLPSIMGMRGAESNLDLRVGATSNMFQLENKRNKLVVAGTTLIESRPGAAQETFEMFNYNGDLGAFYALTKTVENTRTTDSGSETSVEKFAIFLSEAHVRQSSANDCLLIATPTSADSFRIELYAPAQQLSWFQKVFGSKGRIDPKSNRWQNPFKNTFHSDATVN